MINGDAFALHFPLDSSPLSTSFISARRSSAPKMAPTRGGGYRGGWIFWGSRRSSTKKKEKELADLHCTQSASSLNIAHFNQRQCILRLLIRVRVQCCRCFIHSLHREQKPGGNEHWKVGKNMKKCGRNIASLASLFSFFPF